MESTSEYKEERGFGGFAEFAEFGGFWSYRVGIGDGFIFGV